MSVRMTVKKYVIGNHDPLVLEGSSPDKGINWEPGTEIVVTEELAEKFERSGMATRFVFMGIDLDANAETASLATNETAVRQTGRRRARA